MKKRILLLGLLLLAAPRPPVAALPEARQLPPPAASEVKPAARDFTFVTLESRRFKLADLRGKVVLINYWATWCGPCVKEMPALATLYEKYRNRGVEVLALSLDAPDKAQEVRNFVRTHKLGFPVIHDPTTNVLFDVEGLPVSLFLDRQGKLRDRKVGSIANSVEAWETTLNELLSEDAGNKERR